MTLQLEGWFARRGDTPLGDHCGIDRTMQLVGNRTSMLLLREAFHGTTRFDALHRRVGVTEAVAAQRLKELVAAGVLTKEPYREPGQRTRHEYRLTEAGHALLPIVIALLEWGGRYTPSEFGPSRLTHADCGAPAHVEIHCEAGHAVPEEDLVVRAPHDR
ncbi:winged helix-turn-helix transcriptional regulator [Streptacidiphilus melanogenes]|uniref:winged helix-turn-helix transcriptional regulator n=1 Tax=Streptacidiphilus melanogenes TaxID=411235 RepID=UPI0005A91320|nr:helix-turn-helix domain-containing protein [Streptacidiphilus melanogenes]